MFSGLLNNLILDIYELVLSHHLMLLIILVDHYQLDEKKRGRNKMSRRLPNDPYFLFKDTMQLKRLDTNSYVLHMK